MDGRLSRRQAFLAALLFSSGFWTATEALAPTLDQARSLIDQGRYAEAEAVARELLADAEAGHGADSFQAAEALDLLVEALNSGGKSRDPEARRLAERTLAIKEKEFGPDHPHVASSLRNLAIVLAETGDHAGARSLFERALAIRERALGPEHPDVALTLNGLGNVLRNAGDYAAARSAYERALEIREEALGPEHPDVASSLNNLGRLLVRTGDYATARRLLERALAINEKKRGPDHPYLAYDVNMLAILLGETGDYAGARPLFERALAIREKTLGPDHPETGASVNNLALVLMKLRDYEGARPLLERALAIRERSQGPEHADVAQGINNLALLHMRRGDHAAARPLLERALKIYEKALGPEHSEVALALFNLGTLMTETGDFSEARPFLERALEIRERAFGPIHPHVAAVLESLANVHARNGDQRGALDLALRTEQISRDHLRLTAVTLPERQALRYASVRPHGLDLALSLATEGIPPELVRTTWDALVRSRALVLDEMAVRHRTVGGAGDPEISRLAEHLASARTRLANLMVQGPGGEPAGRYVDLLDTARKEKEQAERTLAEKSSSFRTDRARGRLGLTEVAASLPGESSLLAYVRYDRAAGVGAKQAGPSERAVPSYMALVMKSGNANPAAVPLGTAEEIDALIRRWKEAVAEAPPVVPAAGRAAEAGYREAGEKLRMAVWDPIARHLRGSRRVFLVPDGALHLVSFATLPIGRDRYLAESGPLVHYLSAERDLVRDPERDATGRGLLVLGSPDFDTRPGPLPAGDHVLIAGAGQGLPSGSGVAPAPYRGPTATCEVFRSRRWGPLPGARTEADEIESLWKHGSGGRRDMGGEVLKLTGPQAAEAAFKRIASGRRIVHLATHGYFLEDLCPSALERKPGAAEEPAAGPSLPPLLGENPLLLSGLVLAGANRRDDRGAGGEEDGVLTAEEIASLDLSGVEWAVLSACETGVGRVQAGEGVLGLRRAFEIAGAGTLIMSLWRVKDEPAREWMRELYRGRLQGASTAEAVRRAGLKIIVDRRRAGRDAHPFFWGAFVAAGDWR